MLVSRDYNPLKCSINKMGWERYPLFTYHFYILKTVFFMNWWIREKDLFIGDRQDRIYFYDCYSDICFHQMDSIWKIVGNKYDLWVTMLVRNQTIVWYIWFIMPQKNLYSCIVIFDFSQNIMPIHFLAWSINISIFKRYSITISLDVNRIFQNVLFEGIPKGISEIDDINFEMNKLFQLFLYFFQCEKIRLLKSDEDIQITCLVLLVAGKWAENA